MAQRTDLHGLGVRDHALQTSSFAGLNAAWREAPPNQFAPGPARRTV